MRPLLVCLSLCCVAGVLMGCGRKAVTTGTYAPPPGQQAPVEQTRDLAPGASSEDIATAVEGNTDFAFDLFRAVPNDDGNVMLSPHSTTVALAMLYAGARGRTKTQMADVLHFTLGDERLHRAQSAVDLALAKRSGNLGEGETREGVPFGLDMANQAFVQDGLTIVPAYLDTVATNYGAGLRFMDFMRNPTGCRKEINRWVAERTGNRIIDLMPDDVIRPTTRLVLVNAVCFVARWAHEFDPEDTKPGDFHPAPDKATRCQMMHNGSTYNYAQGPGYSAVELPYLGKEMAMLIVLPEGWEVDALIDGLDAQGWRAITDALAPRPVQLILPKFEFRSRLRLKDTLMSLGMTDAFGDADLSGITGDKSLFVTEIVHQTYVAVHEKGTEAAAATGVIAKSEAASTEIKMTVDRPFLFAIRDRQTGAVLFLGCVRDPSVTSA